MKNVNYDTMTSEQLDNLMKTYESNLRLVCKSIENINDKIGPLNDNEEGKMAYFCKRMHEIESEMKKIEQAKSLKNGVRLSPDRIKHSGRIEIDFRDISTESKAELYRFLNRLTANESGFRYGTVMEQQSVYIRPEEITITK